MKTDRKIWFENVCLKDPVRRRLLFTVGMLLTLVLLYPVLTDDRQLKKIDYKVYDFLTNLLPDREPSPIIAIVDIDDRSLQNIGQWPWPRYKTAQLLKTIADDGAAAVGIDIVFSEEDRTSLKNIQKSFADDFGINLRFSENTQGLTDNDGFMAQVLSGGPFVVSNFFLFEEEAVKDKSCVFDPVKIYGLNGRERFFQAKSVLCSLQQFTRASGSAGFFNALPDEDGIMRRLPLLINYDYATFPNLSLETYKRAMGQKEIEIDEGFNGYSLILNNKKIPISSDGTVLLNFNNHRKGYTYYSAADVLYGMVKPDTFRGRIVLVGSSAAGMNDLHSTSTQAYCPGVEVHATFIDNMINGAFIRIPEWSKYLNIALVIILGVIISFYSGKAKSAGVLFFLPIILFLITGISYLILYTAGVYISPAPVVLTICIIWVVLTSINYYVEEKRSLIRTRMLAETQTATIRSMASVAETRDPETGGHIFRTQYYVKALAEHLMKKGLFKTELTHDSAELMYMSAPLHDVGKVGIPDHILLKPGRLTDEEFEIMKSHAELGAEIIGRAESGLSDSGFLYYAALIALSHHEKWDGTGYPYRLKGTGIPLCGRLMAVADVYDALISKRHYKEAMPHEKAMSVILEGREKHFDPVIVDAFTEIEDEIKAIAAKYADED